MKKIVDVNFSVLHELNKLSTSASDRAEARELATAFRESNGHDATSGDEINKWVETLSTKEQKALSLKMIRARK